MRLTCMFFPEWELPLNYQQVGPHFNNLSLLLNDIAYKLQASG